MKSETRQVNKMDVQVAENSRSLAMYSHEPVITSSSIKMHEHLLPHGLHKLLHRLQRTKAPTAVEQQSRTRSPSNDSVGVEPAVVRNLLERVTTIS